MAIRELTSPTASPHAQFACLLPQYQAASVPGLFQHSLAMPSKPIITVIGSLNTDLITRTSHIPSPGETLTAKSFQTGSGGKGANQAVACARLSRTKATASAGRKQRLGTDGGLGNAGLVDPADGQVIVKMVGAVGEDEFGRFLVGGLDDDGVDTAGIVLRKDAKTGVACIIVEDETGENRILMSPNANYTLQPEQFDDFSTPPPDLIVLQLEIPFDTVLQILRTAKAKDIPTLVNPAPAMQLPDEAYGHITHLIVNESEASMLSGKSDDYVSDHENLPGIAQRYLDLGVQTVIITLGGKGVFFTSLGGVTGLVPAQKTTVLDTSAAGDTFVGAYAVELAKSKGAAFDLGPAVEWANKAAAKTVAKEGTQSSIPWLDEISD